MWTHNRSRSRSRRRRCRARRPRGTCSSTGSSIRATSRSASLARAGWPTSRAGRQNGPSRPSSSRDTRSGSAPSSSSTCPRGRSMSLRSPRWSTAASSGLLCRRVAMLRASCATASTQTRSLSSTEDSARNSSPPPPRMCKRGELALSLCSIATPAERHRFLFMLVAVCRRGLRGVFARGDGFPQGCMSRRELLRVRRRQLA
mmetsp:Transcript_18350/g.42037  ORF Transcript_18350/g.42037 Transcript_18350/m.42037 type:complete len:202 (-) Transcript_18350:503-1108(-)